jgi:hypothetical protein
VRSFLGDPERSKVAPAIGAGVADDQFVAAVRSMGFDLAG